MTVITYYSQMLHEDAKALKLTHFSWQYSLTHYSKMQEDEVP